MSTLGTSTAALASASVYQWNISVAVLGGGKVQYKIHLAEGSYTDQALPVDAQKAFLGFLSVMEGRVGTLDISKPKLMKDSTPEPPSEASSQMPSSGASLPQTSGPSAAAAVYEWTISVALLGGGKLAYKIHLEESSRMNQTLPIDAQKAFLGFLSMMKGHTGTLQITKSISKTVEPLSQESINCTQMSAASMFPASASSTPPSTSSTVCELGPKGTVSALPGVLTSDSAMPIPSAPLEHSPGTAEEASATPLAPSSSAPMGDVELAPLKSPKISSPVSISQRSTQSIPSSRETSPSRKIAPSELIKLLASSAAGHAASTLSGFALPGDIGSADQSPRRRKFAALAATPSTPSGRSTSSCKGRDLSSVSASVRASGRRSRHALSKAHETPSVLGAAAADISNKRRKYSLTAPVAGSPASPAAIYAREEELSPLRGFKTEAEDEPTELDEVTEPDEDGPHGSGYTWPGVTKREKIDGRSACDQCEKAPKDMHKAFAVYCNHNIPE